MNALLRFFCGLGTVRAGRKGAHLLQVLDRFLVMQRMTNRVVDEVRAPKAPALKAQGEVALTHTGGCPLERPKHQTGKQEVKWAELLCYNLKVVQTYLLKDNLQFCWDYRYPSGGKVHGPLVYPRLALTHRADEGSGPHVAEASIPVAEAVEVALYHTLGALPEPEWTHKLC